MEGLIHSALHPVLEALVALVLGLIAAAAGRVARKYGLENEAQTFFRNREIAKAIVLKVEEEVESLAKRGGLTYGEKADEKIERAVSAVVDRIPGISHEEAHALALEAVARTKGLGASDFLGDVVTAATSGPK